MIVAVDPNETWEFVPEAELDTPAEDRFSLTIRVATSAERRRLLTGLQSMNDGKSAAGDVIFGTVQAMLCGWNNLRTASGSELEFRAERKGDRPPAQRWSMDRLPGSVVQEAYFAILEREGGKAPGSEAEAERRAQEDAEQEGKS